MSESSLEGLNKEQITDLIKKVLGELEDFVSNVTFMWKVQKAAGHDGPYDERFAKRVQRVAQAMAEASENGIVKYGKGVSFPTVQGTVNQYSNSPAWGTTEIRTRNLAARDERRKREKSQRDYARSVHDKLVELGVPCTVTADDTQIIMMLADADNLIGRLITAPKPEEPHAQ
jgi:hypothetical protein